MPTERVPTAPLAVKIRPATHADRDAICALFDAAFAPSHYESRLYELVSADHKPPLAWVTELDGDLIAGVLYTPALCGAEPIGSHLAPVAVHPDFQRGGIGSELIRASLRDPALAPQAIFVLGEPSFYERFGFLRVTSARCPYDEGNRHFRALRWKEREEPFEIGFIAAFAECDRVLEFANFMPGYTDELLAMWRASFEQGVGISDLHPLADQRAYLLEQLVPHFTIRLAFREGHLVGFAAARPGKLEQLYVHVDHHREGIGTQLLDWAKAQSGGSLRLFTFDRNMGAQRFYEKHGFRMVGRGFEDFWQLDDIEYEWRAPAPES